MGTKNGWYVYRAKNNNVIEAKPSGYTILGSDVGKTFSNEGASATVAFTLPSA